jgi:hypothetical protein
MTRLAASLISLCIGLVSLNSHALSQDGRSLKDQLAGSWKLSSIHSTRPDGTKYELFGPQAKGMIIFDRNGTYSFQIMRALRPSFAAESRMEGSPDENRAAVQGMISHFGKYNIDEVNRLIHFQIEGSSYPNWDGTEQKRYFTILGNQLTWSEPSAVPKSGDLQSDLVWKR